jgi:4-amino-4-deoxy-L-arabinose transferase-like glycosyltransferase
VTHASGETSPAHLRPRWVLAILIGLAACSIGLRLPLVLREPGWQDEDCYTVPGLTILKTGVPQLPQVPSRNADQAFYKADVVMLLEPPLSFYLQAVFYSVLPDEIWAARLVSLFSGAASLVLLGHLALRCRVTLSAAAWTVGLFLLSRWFYFTAMRARPDMLCTMFGLASIVAVERWMRDPRLRWLLVAGVALGLGGLTHPFAIVYAVQLAAWMFLSQTGRLRWQAPMILAAVSVAMASTWIILIVQEPDAFRIQMGHQLVHSQGGGLLQRIVWPFDVIRFHAWFLWSHVEIWQLSLGGCGAIACVVFGRRDQTPLLTVVGWFAITGALSLCILVGTHHPIFGYFTYPSALAFVGIGWMTDRGLRALASLGPIGRVTSIAMGIALLISFLAGSRLRMTAVYLKNWNDVEFNAPRFADALLERLPPDATYMVDQEFILDFIAAGRKTLASGPYIWGALPRDIPYDYRIQSRSSDYAIAGVDWSDSPLWEMGDPTDPFGCYVKVHHRQPAAKAD